MPRNPKDLAYRPPAPGAADSADPTFKTRQRECGKCGSGFWTTVARRYYCRACWDRTKFQQADVPLISVAGGGSGRLRIRATNFRRG